MSIFQVYQNPPKLRKPTRPFYVKRCSSVFSYKWRNDLIHMHEIQTHTHTHTPLPSSFVLRALLGFRTASDTSKMITGIENNRKGKFRAKPHIPDLLAKCLLQERFVELGWAPPQSTGRKLKLKRWRVSLCKQSRDLDDQSGHKPSP